MVTLNDAVCIWEDVVGDSGEAPTDEELHAFALAVEAKARKPFVKLQNKWKRKQKEFRSYQQANPNTTFGDDARMLSNAYGLFAHKLKNRLDASHERNK